MPVEHFDAVEGGVANDRIFRTVELYFAEEISKEDALKRLKYEKPNHQICLLNQRLIDKYLTYIRTEELQWMPNRIFCKPSMVVLSEA